jgi:glutathione synthase/RimK-type ligase-like ATP-grasp enzyme
VGRIGCEEPLRELASALVDTFVVTSPTAPRRRAFVDQIAKACADVGATVRWFSAEWVAEITYSARRVLVIGQVFPLNNASAAHVATDKVAAYELLRAAEVPAVPHHLLRYPMAADVMVESALAACGGAPLVVKPHRESSGFDVRRADDETGLRDLVDYFATRYRAIAVSPWQDVTDEYRIVVLDGDPLLVYRKDLADGPEWRHNLQFGARPALDVDPALRTSLQDLAARAMCALDLRFASVDVVQVANRSLVLEVNSGVTLEHFGHAGPEHRRLADEVYRRAVRACLSC